MYFMYFIGVLSLSLMAVFLVSKIIYTAVKHETRKPPRLSLYQTNSLSEEIRRFRCWLCRSETKFYANTAPGRYTAECHYCRLPCLFDVDESSKVVQARPGEIPVPMF